MWRSARSEHRINVRIEEVMEKRKKNTQRHNIFIGHRASCIAFICLNEVDVKSAEEKRVGNSNRTNEKKTKEKTEIAVQEWTATQTV